MESKLSFVLKNKVSNPDDYQYRPIVSVGLVWKETSMDKNVSDGAYLILRPAILWPLCSLNHASW